MAIRMDVLVNRLRDMGFAVPMTYVDDRTADARTNETWVRYHAKHRDRFDGVTHAVIRDALGYPPEHTTPPAEGDEG